MRLHILWLESITKYKSGMNGANLILEEILANSISAVDNQLSQEAIINAISGRNIAVR